MTRPPCPGRRGGAEDCRGRAAEGRGVRRGEACLPGGAAPSGIILKDCQPLQMLVRDPTLAARAEQLQTGYSARNPCALLIGSVITAEVPICSDSTCSLHFTEQRGPSPEATRSRVLDGPHDAQLAAGSKHPNREAGGRKAGQVRLAAGRAGRAGHGPPGAGRAKPHRPDAACTQPGNHTLLYGPGR